MPRPQLADADNHHQEIDELMIIERAEMKRNSKICIGESHNIRQITKSPLSAPKESAPKESISESKEMNNSMYHAL